MMQELGEDSIQVFARVHQLIVNSFSGATAADLDQVLLESLQVAVAEGAGIAQNLGELLHPLEPSGAGERKGQLFLIQNMEDENIVPAVTEHFQSAKERLTVHQEIGDEDDQAAARRVFER